jgi:hypothetical protein
MTEHDDKRILTKAKALADAGKKHVNARTEFRRQFSEYLRAKGKETEAGTDACRPKTVIFRHRAE